MKFVDEYNVQVFNCMKIVEFLICLVNLCFIMLLRLDLEILVQLSRLLINDKISLLVQSITRTPGQKLQLVLLAMLATSEEMVSD